MDKDDLLNYMPDYYDGVYEMEELLKGQGFSLSELSQKQRRTLLNEFVIQTDIKGISVFEDQVGIVPDDSLDLKTRQENVLLRLMPPQPITVRFMQRMFDKMEIKAVFSSDYPNRIALVNAKTEDLKEGQIYRLKFLLNIYLPANMGRQIYIALPEISKTTNYWIGAKNVGETENYFQTEKINLD